MAAPRISRAQQGADTRERILAAARRVLADEGLDRFTNGVQVDGDTLTMTIPSRMVMPDPDLKGFDYSGLRWTVVAQDQGTCDILGARARPTRHINVLKEKPAPTPSPDTVATTPAPGGPLVPGGFLTECALAIVVGGAVGFLVARRRRRAE